MRRVCCATCVGGNVAPSLSMMSIVTTSAATASLSLSSPLFVHKSCVAARAMRTATAATTHPTTTRTTQRTFATCTSILLGRRIRANKRARSREPSEGDWVCQCGETNKRSKRECYKCGAPAPPLPPGVRRPSLPGEDPHDWACACGQMNFRGSVLCYKCQQPKPEPPPLPGKEVTLWTCAKCKSINRSSRKFCYKCSLPSPLLDFKPLQ